MTASARPRLRPSFHANWEPPLGELLSDPTLHRLMERDGVRMTALLSLIGEVREQIDNAFISLLSFPASPEYSQPTPAARR
jgi:hypothetical protein